MSKEVRLMKLLVLFILIQLFQQKLIGYRISSSVMSILHTIYLSGNTLSFENMDLSDETSRKNNILKTPTITYPFLETEKGNISQTNSILYYIASKYNKNLIGKNAFENAKINQWIEFANNEINQCLKEIIYPIFGWKNYDKDLYNNKNN